MNTFVAHPSVRIKGTESNYQPVRCLETSCSDHLFHMHCPLCVKTDVYQDPVILKAHFRVKHVDKGIDFAGLKILRCCDHCDIIGIIKGEKKFKGAHWHCYKCRNGFNRRDEAIKHYKTHFRNPQTTFQIQIAQEINQASTAYQENILASTATVDQTGLSVHPTLTQAVITTGLTQGQSLLSSPNGQLNLTSNRSSDGTIGVSVAANETVQSSEGQGHHIMIIQEEPLDRGEETYTTQIISSEGVDLDEDKEQEEGQGFEELQQQANHQNSNNRFEELQHKYEELLLEKMTNEQTLKEEIQRLKQQVDSLQTEVDTLRKREQDLLQQVSLPLDENIFKLLTQLQNQHRNLLHQQLLEIKRSCNVKTIGKPHASLETEDQASVFTSVNSAHVQSAALEAEKVPGSDGNRDIHVVLTEVPVGQEMQKEVQLDSTFVDAIEDKEMGESDTNLMVHSGEGDGTLGNKGPQEPYVVCIEYADLPNSKVGNFRVTSTSLELSSSAENDSSEEPLAKKLKPS